MAYALPTRSASEDPIFGQYLDQLPQNKLPLKSEIYRNYLFRRETEFQLLYARDGKIIKSVDETTKNKIVNDIVKTLINIWWTKASIPVREDKHIFDEIKKLLKLATDFSKDTKTIKSIGKEEYLKRKGFDKILDVSKCRYILKDFMNFLEFFLRLDFSGALLEQNRLKKFSGLFANANQSFLRLKSSFMQSKGSLGKA